MNKLTAEKCRELIGLLREKQAHPRKGLSGEEKLYLRALEIALPVLEQQQPQTDTYRQIDNDDWAEWKGGDNPAEGKFVQVRFRDGMVDEEQPSASYRWYHDTNDCDIIAYRVIENDGREG